MKIAILGYGRMGRHIEAIALQRGHEVVLTIGRDNQGQLHTEVLQSADVAIDFSVAEVAVAHISTALAVGVPVVSGTTGWLDHWEEVVAAQKRHQGAFLYAANFSLGVNLFFALNRHLARLMQPHVQYRASIEETHHIHKLDAPSGTAIRLAEDLITSSDYAHWQLGESDDTEALPIIAHRVGEVPGTHVVTYTSAEDGIQLAHRAHNRAGFARGAVLAAEWLSGKVGIFGMKDVLGI